MYKLGTLDQFNIEDLAAKKAAGLTQDEINKGNLLSKEQNSNNSDQYLWESKDGDIEDPFNILAVWSKYIKGHKNVKYYIAHNGSITFGKVAVGTEIKFGRDINFIEIFDNEDEFLARTEELGIIVEGGV
jgi:hypothetical protein